MGYSRWSEPCLASLGRNSVCHATQLSLVHKNKTISCPLSFILFRFDRSIVASNFDSSGEGYGTTVGSRAGPPAVLGRATRLL